MICILAPTYNKAKHWADNQGLDRSEWFYPEDENVVRKYTNYHLIVVGEFPDYQLSWFEKIYHLAKRYGALGRT